MQGMNRKIGIGILWNLASIFMGRGASLVFTLFLARLLAPEAFGLIAMVTICFEAANVFVQSGLGQALIRSKQISQADLNTVFFINLGLSILAYLALFYFASSIASFYSQPELTFLIQVIGLVVFINAAKVVQVAVLCRNMNFKLQMKANTLGVALSGMVAIFMAQQGAGVWSLVAQILVSALVSTTVLWLAGTWQPALIFSTESFIRLFRFGSNLLAEGMLDVLFRNSHVLLIGRFFSAELTGLYFFARKVSDLISQQLTNAIEQASFPALSTLQDDNAQLRYKYRQIIQLMMFMIAPSMLLLAALAMPLFSLFLDEKWKEAVPYLQLLCLAGVLYPLHALNMNILNVKGRSDLVLKVGLLKRTINILLLFITFRYGVLAIIISQVVGSILALIPNTYFSAKLIGYGFKDQALDAFKPLLTAFLAAFGAWAYAAISSLPLFWLLCVSGSLGLLIYLVVSLIIRAEGLLLLMYKINQRLRSKQAII